MQKSAILKKILKIRSGIRAAVVSGKNVRNALELEDVFVFVLHAQRYVTVINTALEKATIAATV